MEGIKPIHEENRKLKENPRNDKVGWKHKLEDL
jgi:hypothetical protein